MPSLLPRWVRSPGNAVRAWRRRGQLPLPGFPHRRVALEHFPLSVAVPPVRSAYEAAYGLRGPGRYREADWRRASFALTRIHKSAPPAKTPFFSAPSGAARRADERLSFGMLRHWCSSRSPLNHEQSTHAANGSVLDVGSNRGQFPNVLAGLGLFRSVVSVDVRKNEAFLFLQDSIDYQEMSVCALDFEEDAFDVVTCFEVIEHLDPHLVSTALRELRRVCKHHLLLSVPYAEPEPISRFHKRRFVDEDFEQLFPDADFTLITHGTTRWMHIEEQEP